MVSSMAFRHQAADANSPTSEPEFTEDREVPAIVNIISHRKRQHPHKCDINELNLSRSKTCDCEKDCAKISLIRGDCSSNLEMRFKSCFFPVYSVYNLRK